MEQQDSREHPRTRLRRRPSALPLDKDQDRIGLSCRRNIIRRQKGCIRRLGSSCSRPGRAQRPRHSSRVSCPPRRKEGADWRGVKLREHCINDEGEPFPRLGGSSQRLVAPSHRRPIQSVKIAVVEMVAHRLPHLVESRSLDRRSARLAMNRPSTQCGKATEGQGAPARDAYVAHDDATANRCTCQVQRQDDRFVSGLFCRHAKLGRSQRSQLSVVDDAHPCGRKDNVRERPIIWILAQHVMRHVSKKTMIGSKLFITLFSRPPGVISVRSG
jgi:hypothetical protein